LIKALDSNGSTADTTNTAALQLLLLRDVNKAGSFKAKAKAKSLKAKSLKAKSLKAKAKAKAKARSLKAKTKAKARDQG